MVEEFNSNSLCKKNKIKQNFKKPVLSSINMMNCVDVKKQAS